MLLIKNYFKSQLWFHLFLLGRRSKIKRGSTLYEPLLTTLWGRQDERKRTRGQLRGQNRLVPRRYICVLGWEKIGVRLRRARGVMGRDEGKIASLPMRPQARLNLTPNLLSPPNHINSDWARVRGQNIALWKEQKEILFPSPHTQIVATHAIFCYKSTTDKVLFHDKTNETMIICSWFRNILIHRLTWLWIRRCFETIHWDRWAVVCLLALSEQLLSDLVLYRLLLYRVFSLSQIFQFAQILTNAVSFLPSVI